MKDNRRKIGWFDKEFDEELQEIQTERIKLGKDKPHKEKSKTRLTLGIKRHPLWDKIKKDLCLSDLKDDLRGSSIDLPMIAIIGFIVLITFGAFIYLGNAFNNAISGIPAIPQLGLNFTRIASATTGQMVTGLNNLIWISFSMFIAYILALFITSYYSRGNPVYFGINFLIVIISIIVSVYLSNSYESLLSNSLLDATYQSFTAMNFFMQYLPFIIGGVGMINLIFLFGAILKNQNQVAIG